MFSKRISNRSLALLCRSLGTMLRSGVSLKKSLRTSANKTKDPKLQSIMGNVSQEIISGSTLADAFRTQNNIFPELFLDMIQVAEKTGSLPEVFAELAEHYDNLVRLKREFIGLITFPIIQLVAAVLIIAGLIYLLGLIAKSSNTEGHDFLGFGLMGASGATIWLSLTFGSALCAFVLYKVLSGSLKGKRALDQWILKIPVFGNCARSFAIARFSWAYHLTQNSGMPIRRSLKASLQATGNGAFISAQQPIIRGIMKGEELSEVMSQTELFPEDYLEMVRVGETSGTVPELLHEMGPEFEENARRSLRAMATTLAWIIWLLVSGFIIFIVITIMLSYVRLIESFL